MRIPFRVGATLAAYTGRFFETRWSPEAVILSAAKDLRLARREILRCAQDDTSHLAGSFPKKPTRVSFGGAPQASLSFAACGGEPKKPLLRMHPGECVALTRIHVNKYIGVHVYNNKGRNR